MLTPTILAVACVAAVSPSLYFASPLASGSAGKLAGSGGRRRDGYEDGETSEASVVKGGRGMRLAVVGFVVATALMAALRRVLQGLRVSDGVIVCGWMIAVVDAIYLSYEAEQRKRFAIGIWICACSALLSATLVTGWFVDEGEDAHASPGLTGLGQLILGLGAVVVSVSLQRRPDVYLNDRTVDRQDACSALERYTFAWVRPLLDQARRSRSLEYDDLPALGYATRSRGLQESLSFAASSGSHRQSLWRAIVRDHYTTVVKQWALGILESFAMILPPLCLYKILTILEQQSITDTSDEPSSLWPWVVCLAGSKILHVGIDNWLQWVSFAMFMIPVRSQLSAAVFAKSLRMKSTHSGLSQSGTADDKTAKGQVDDIQDDDDSDETRNLIAQAPVDQGPDRQQNAETPEAPSTGIVNLLAVDIERVADFCGYNVDLVRGAAKVIVAAAFLVYLIGWWSTLAGFAVPAIMQPLNNFATKHYTSTQLAVMSARDDKAHVVTEALHGIRQIKFSATERQWERRILSYRERELQAQRNVYGWGIFLTFTWITMPAFIGAVALSVYAVIGQRMVASVAFTALSVFASLEWTLGAVPQTITEMLDASVSVNRIQQHLESTERQISVQHGEAVQLRAASIAWPAGDAVAQDPLLVDVSLRFPPNELSVINGATGTGKSLLLAAIIGEAELISGEIHAPWVSATWAGTTSHSDDWIIPSACAYVGQVPWIENASVKDTILFGLPYNHERYLQVVHACALVDDIKMLPDGDDTEIGATGINLSGGQRWRLTFARALYSRAGLLVLDDIFSAVDSHVGRHLLDNALLGPLGINRTRILVTHHIGLVERFAAYVVTLHAGGTSSTVENESAERVSASGTTSAVKFEVAPGRDDADVDISMIQDAIKPAPRKFTADETRQQGRVKWSVYSAYIAASGGWWFWTLALLLFSLSALSVVARSYWLALWTRTYTVEEITGAKAPDPVGASSLPPHHGLLFYLTIYVVIALAAAGLVAIKIAFVIFASLRSARQLFEMATSKVIRAPLRWLDTEPVGRILNRFVRDFALIDTRLGGDVTWCANGIFTVISIIVAALLVSPWMLLFVAVLVALCLYVVYLYMDAARDVKRLESNSKSPIFEHIGSTLSGLPTIRSFARADKYLDLMYAKVDVYAQTSWYVLLTTQWMRFRQSLLGVVFTLCIAIAVAVLPGVDASLAGFALSFALDFSAIAENTITRYTSTELDMNSTERVLEYAQLDTETPSGSDAATSWPPEGRLVVRDLEVGYAKDLDSVLKGINFSVQPRERVGIVGRTGSGKSSLTLALFRFLEARRGSIEIDGTDISSLKLHDLRSRLAIIPQDPVLFSGTLRSNMDPFDEYDDDTLIDALSRVKAPDLKGSSALQKLGRPIARGGSNLSQGEKQLVCLARAILSRPKILVLDEATSAVDMDTDALIQRSIREDFRDSTLLVVAHRLSTVADFDKILVMDGGRVAEYDSPDILARRQGVFWKMLKDSGEHQALGHLLQSPKS